MYRFRKEYSDIQPIGQEGQDIPIVAIRYSDEFRETFNYFRAIFASQEKSERALNVTTHALNLNPNNYTVWDYRRQIIKAIKYNLQKELFYIDYLIKENPGNHLMWHHRRIIANSCLGSLNMKHELELTETVLSSYAKSYNALEHRQWIINTFKYNHLGLPREELKFTEKFIEEDVRNNSAWNQRFFIVKKMGVADFEIVKQEIKFTLKYLKKVVDNESAWSYLKGLLKNFGERNLRQFDEIVDFVENLYYEQKNCNRHLVAFLIDLKIETILDLYESNEINHTRKVKDLCDLMANHHDKIRHRYWKFVYKQFYFDKIKSRYKSSDSSSVHKKIECTWNKATGRIDFGNNGKINENSINLSFDNKLNESMIKNNGLMDAKRKVEKKKERTKKKKTPERTIKIGTGLLYGLISKYNNNDYIDEGKIY